MLAKYGLVKYIPLKRKGERMKELVTRKIDLTNLNELPTLLAEIDEDEPIDAEMSAETKFSDYLAVMQKIEHLPFPKVSQWDLYQGVAMSGGVVRVEWRAHTKQGLKRIYAILLYTRLITSGDQQEIKVLEERIKQLAEKPKEKENEERADVI